VEEYARVVERLYKSRIWELDTMFGGVVEELRRADLLDASLVSYSHTAPLKDWADLRRVPSLLREFYPRDDPALIWVSQRRGDQVFKYRNLGNGKFGFQAFDLASDPTEQRDLLDTDDPRHREAMRELLAYKSELIEAWSAHASDVQVPGDEANAMLRSLGYRE
jgi:hypothetical protein